MLCVISIHAPAKGATVLMFIRWIPEVDFNPRSREGSDVVWYGFRKWRKRFQSTLPRRERRGLHCKWLLTFSDFNPRSREGSDMPRTFTVCSSTDFNPRSREGSDQYPFGGSFFKLISIHAPAKGATSKITYFFSNIDFYLGNTNKLQYCSFHFTILLIIFLLLSMVRTPLPFYVRLPPAPAYIIRIPSAS